MQKKQFDSTKYKKIGITTKYSKMHRYRDLQSNKKDQKKKKITTKKEKKNHNVPKMVASSSLPDSTTMASL